MPLRAAPLTLAGLVLAAAVDLWLLAHVTDLATKTPPTLETAEWKPRLSAAGEPAVPARPIADYQQILARPLFSKTRAPFVPPPPPLPAPASTPAPPAPVFVDPGFSIGGLIISGMIRKAYLMKKPQPHGVWVREGEDFMGWKLQSITASAATLRQNDRTIEVRLYPEP